MSTTTLPLVARRAGYDRPHRRRSRNGCLTCKRRKVRCNEQRPQCFHCQRLSLECEWKDGASQQQPSPPKDALAAEVSASGSNVAPAAAASALDVDCWPTPAADLFDFAHNPASSADPAEDFSLFQDIYLPDLCADATTPRPPLHGRTPLGPDPAASLGSPLTIAHSPRHSSLFANLESEDSLLLHAPPIFDPVENGPICASLRALLDSMASSSPMVRHAIAAFAAIQFFTTGEKIDYRRYYDKAAKELAERFPKPGGGVAASSSELRYVLTTIFFLTYINVRVLGSFPPPYGFSFFLALFLLFFSDLSFTFRLVAFVFTYLLTFWEVLDGAAGSSPRQSCQGA